MSISANVVIMTQDELLTYRNEWFDKGIKRGRFEERCDQSQAKATEGKAGNAEGTPLVRQTTTGTGLQVGEAVAVQPATSEIMDVTAGETAPSPSDPAQEPQAVAWQMQVDGKWWAEDFYTDAESQVLVKVTRQLRRPLYTRPVSLDREAIIHIINEKVGIGGISDDWERPYLEGVEDVADAILALIEGRT